MGIAAQDTLTHVSFKQAIAAACKACDLAKSRREMWLL